MSRKGKLRAVCGGLLTLALVVTCVAVYQNGSKSTPNEKEFVKEDTEDSVDQAIRTEEREEEVQDANTSEVEGEKEIETEETGEDTEAETEEAAQDAEPEVPAQEPAEETVPEEPAQETANAALAPDMNFTESSLMEWPVNGQVLIDYNMEHTVYFPTLNVYKLNPGIVVSSEVGAPVASVANGQVVSIAESEETGTTVTVDMGNGYQAIYGQLRDVALQLEDYVTAGSVLGYVNEPTKYYSKEGANLYFALTKDGSPLDPLQYLP